MPDEPHELALGVNERVRTELPWNGGCPTLPRGLPPGLPPKRTKTAPAIVILVQVLSYAAISAGSVSVR